MLVLSRQRDETIMIGDEIEITVVDIRGDKVRLGISAPTQIAVHRKEIYEAIRKENAQACGLENTDLNGAIRPGRTKVSAALRAGSVDSETKKRKGEDARNATPSVIINSKGETRPHTTGPRTGG